MKIMISSIAAWVILLILAILNGLIREELYKQYLEELHAHQLSSVTFIAMILLVQYVFLRFIKMRRMPYTSVTLWRVGVFWLVMTVSFEFPFGHYVAGHSWEKLFHDYNILEGRLWSLVLVVTLSGFWLVNKLGFKSSTYSSTDKQP